MEDQVKEPQISNSIQRGQLAEFEEVISNIQSSIEHLFDLPILSFQDINIVKGLRKARKEAVAMFLVDIDTNYWCAYKHLLLAQMQTKELIQSKLDNGQNVDSEIKLLNAIHTDLNHVRIKLLRIDESKLDDPDCIRCIEDYLINNQPPSLSTIKNEFKTNS
jgi:pyruvate-formate lyase